MYLKGQEEGQNNISAVNVHFILTSGKIHVVAVPAVSNPMLDDQLYTATCYEVDLRLMGKWYQVMQKGRKGIDKDAFN